MKGKIMKNTGLIIEPLAPEDYRFGSSGLGKVVRVPNGDWSDYLPTGEKQKRQDADKMWCVSASAENTIETEFEYVIQNKSISADDLQWLYDKGYMDENGKPDFSDRYTAIVSKTNGSGNSPKRVAQAIGTRTNKSKEFGLIPEKMLPYRRSMSWLECYGYGKWDTPNTKLITKEMIALGREFLERFPTNYEFPSSNEFDEVLKYNPIQVFVHAWNGISNGVYIRTTAGINHAVEMIKKRPNQKIFDSYEEYIKSLASNFIYMSYGTRFIVQFKQEAKKKDMIKEKLEKYWLAIFHRPLDAGAMPYLKHEDDFVLDEALKSKEWKKIDKILEWVKGNSVWKIFLPADVRGAIEKLKDLQK